MAEILAKTSTAPNFEQMRSDIEKRQGTELKAAKDVALAEYEQKGAELGIQAELAGKKAEKQRELRTELQQEISGLEKQMFPAPERKMTQEDATSYAQLASVVATLGLMLGGGAKGSAKVALSAMNGMMKGWQAGRKDLWERESKTFEAELRKMKAQNDDVNRRIERAMKLMPLKRDEALSELEAASYISSQGILPKSLNTGNYKAALNTLQSVNKEFAALQQLQFKHAQEERRHQETRADRELQRQTMLDAARIRADAAAGKMDNKTKAEIRGNLATLGNISDLSRMLPTVPDAASVFGIIAGNVPENLQQLYSSPQAQQAISLLQNVSSQILKLRSGATVTVAEFARQRGFLPQRSDSTEAIQNKLRGLWDAVTNETTGYGLTQKQLTETAGEISQIPEPLAPSYRPTTREDQSLGSRSSQDGWKIEKVNK